MTLQRDSKPKLLQLLKQFPIVCILGPRQCGKTTFSKSNLPDWTYIDLERPSDLAKIESDPEYFLKQNSKHVIFDEAQLYPELFPILRSAVDDRRQQKGRFVLTGSASFELMQNISETLSGRIGFIDLSPFSLSETNNLSNLWIRGGFPDAYLDSKSTSRWEWYESYTRTFIERDLNRLGIDVSAVQMRKLLSMLSHVHAQLWNASDLASSLGTTYHTINRYTDILEQTFLVRKLQPYFTNISKRLIKSPKIYIRDSGLLHYFLGIQNHNDLDTHPKRGMSWEGFVIEQIIHSCSLIHTGAEYYFWRTATKQEVDLLIKIKNKFTAIEIKTHSAPTKDMVSGLVNCMKDLGIKSGFVINPFDQTYSLGEGIKVIGLTAFINNLKNL